MTDKDVLYVNDLFNLNYNLSKLCTLSINNIDSKDLNDFLTRTKDMHINLCKDLINILGEQNE